MISQSVIEELKIRNNIEDVISSYVRLTRSGQNLKGLCPFHSEKTPSFTVHPTEGFFHCFGCGAGGDVITFVMKAENLAYPDALEFLAQRVGLRLPDEERQTDKDKLTRTEILRMNREAAKYFHSCLLDKRTPEGLRYLTEKRRFSMPLIRHFGLGYAPDGWNGLRDHLKGKGYTYDQMVQANLVQKSANKNSYYDVFRNRVMVPILDAGGNVIAFGGRLLEDGKQPKYLNTSDTAAFKKSKNLFALNFAKDSCAERMILCEGYMDVIALHGAGFSYAVATLGTAITPEQARLMKRYTKSVVISYDADAPGQNAADKAFKLLSEVGLETKLLKVTGAKDPDEFIKKYGKEAFSRLLDGSKTRFDFKFDQILSRYALEKTDEKIKAAEETVALIAGFYSSVEKELYIAKASSKLGISAETLRTDMTRIDRREQKKRKSEQSAEILRQTEGFRDRINPQTIGNVAAVRAEEAILGMLMLRQEIAEKAFGEHTLSAEDFVTEFDCRVFSGLKKLYESGAPIDPGLMGEYFTADEMGRIFGMRQERSALTDNNYSIFLQCVQKLRNSRKRQDTEEDILDIIKKRRSTETLRRKDQNT